MTADEKLDEALKQTFPASDAFWLALESTCCGARPAPQQAVWLTHLNTLSHGKRRVFPWKGGRP